MGAIALVVIAGLIYISGLRQFFFYRKTPEKLKARKMESVLEAKELAVPVYARILRVEDSSDASRRDKENIRRLVAQTNRIWNQADIQLELKGTEKITMNKNQWQAFRESPQRFSSRIDGFDESLINVFFIGNLEGPSGVAYIGSRNILIADYTTAHDFLVFAHEIGHLLGLSHNEPNQGLMAPEAKDPELSKEEIKKARKEGQGFRQ